MEERRHPAAAPRVLVVGLVLGVVTAGAQEVPVREFAIDPGASEVHWRIHKAGAFARFGHNHVVSVPAPAGTISVAAAPADSTFEMRIGVHELVVDDSGLRARYGEDFASEPSQDDIEGTRDNMLGEQVLQGDVFPTIEVRGTGLTAFAAGAEIGLEIELLGRSVAVTAPVDVVLDDDRLTARSQFRLTHEALGMEPFSVMMGALQVGEDLDFTVEIRAERTSVPRSTAPAGTTP